MYPFGFFQDFSFDVFLYVFFRFSNVISGLLMSCYFSLFFQVFSCILLGFFRFSHLMFLFYDFFRFFHSCVFLPVIAPFNVPTLVRNH